MTSDEFNSQYKLLKQITGKGGRTYTAEHLPSQRAVLVHILEETQVGGAAGLHRLLERLPPKDKARILETMTVEGSLVVVTQFLQGLDGFDDWLRAKSSAATPSSSAQPGPPQESHGEFTRLFRSSGDIPNPAADLPAGAGPAPAPPASGFTDLFRAAVPPGQGQGPDRATVPPVRMVGVRVPLAPQAATPEPEPPRLTPNFGPPREPTAAPGGWPRQEEVVIRTGEPPPPPPAPSWGGPSEFTRLIGSMSPATGEVAQIGRASEAPDEPAAPKRSYLPLFVVLNVLFILATGLIVYFALRRC